MPTQRSSQPAATGWVPAASAPIALRVEDLKPQMDVPTFNMCWEILQSPSEHPDSIRYEFVVDLKKRFGYIPPGLLGIFRSDGLVGVVYDPLHPDLHLPLPVIEKYLIIN